MTSGPYTTQILAGLGMVEETRLLLELWTPGMGSIDLQRIALASGHFPNLAARRLRNFVTECFVPRYLINEAGPARWLKGLVPALSSREFEQLLFIFSCRTNAILADFVGQVYWPAYAAGHNTISNDEAREFVIRANQDGKTKQPWSENTRTS